ncbi:hypothetical protein [Pseudonocardia sp. TRM90224]|uniref:hypothetical protein n=1 Tax=Pseudonocardia sp. TRM90224 TaxID=2812678 RepID=UPI001E2BE488|nr:hypothetical protein [Pseudonocardia sp. TRM90224]
MPELRGYRTRDAGLLATAWQGPLLMATGGAGPFAPPPPEPDGHWCRVLVVPDAGVAVLDRIDHVHRTARLSVATLDAPVVDLLAAALVVAGERLRLRQVIGVLPTGDEQQTAAAALGFVAEVTIPEHVWRDGNAVPATIWRAGLDDT